MEYLRYKVYVNYYKYPYMNVLILNIYRSRHRIAETIIFVSSIAEKLFLNLSKIFRQTYLLSPTRT